MRAFQRFLRDDDGTALLEFGFLLPVMLLLFIGVVEATNVLRLDRKVVASAQTAADLLTQRTKVSNAQLDDILTASEMIFEPFPAASHSVGIAAVNFDPDTGSPTLDWTKSKNGGSVPNALALAAGLGDPGDGVVVVRVTYDYTPIFFDFVMGPTTIEETAVLRPRRSSVVEGPGS
ncbi:TadE/TadG family type IV pilus assembly protein [Pelagibius marinus]|uniref:TadE/TadG family type IV pilus assembly protein n=1 Tax=Pelagibius marinus TaxID=2762760 RepID=UPI001872ED63|nr:TadE/TadG family type IV pilus assembly protein [Pelagibius marinus]